MIPLAFLGRIGLGGVIIVMLAVLLAVQTVRLEGLKLWPLSIEGWKPEAQRLRRDLAAVADAQDAALAKAEAAKARAEQDYRDIAERIDTDAQDARQDALADAERFIASGGVRCPANRGSAGGPAASTEARSAGSGEATSAPAELDAPLVGVTADDVRICTANTLQAEAARAWALKIEAASAD